MTIFPICRETKEYIVQSEQTYRINYIYNINKQINKNVNVTKIQWKYNPYIGEAYKKCPR